MYSLVDSQIDRWFNGPVPKFSAEDLGISGSKAPLSEILERAHQVANDPAQMAWRNVRSYLTLGGFVGSHRTFVEYQTEGPERSRQKFGRSRSRRCQPELQAICKARHGHMFICYGIV